MIAKTRAILWRVPVPPWRRAGGVLLAVAALAAVPASAQGANVPPECTGTTTAVKPGGERAFSLRCADRDGWRLDYEIVDEPDHGTLTDLSFGTVEYVPASGYTGNDSFTFRAGDGKAQSAVVTQQLRVTNENLAPQCLELTIRAVDGRGNAIAPCFDPNEGDAVRAAITAPPAHGTARSHGDHLEYTSHDYAGPDTVSIQPSDGTLTGSVTELDVEVVPLEPPTCDALDTLPVRTGTEKRVPVRCADASGHFSYPFSFQTVDPPDHGQLVHEYGGFRYAPASGYTGPDQFKVTASNSAGASLPVTVNVQVADDANEAPTCSSPGVIRVRTGASTSAWFGCSDADGDPLTHAFDPSPAHGLLSTDTSSPFGGTIYTADDGYAGPDAFGVRASDGKAQSAPLVQQVRVIGDDENAPPQCHSESLKTVEGRETSAILHCSDADGDALTYTWSEPEHGTVEQRVGPGSLRALVYKPDAGFSGTDRFTFTGNDGRAEPVPTTVLVEVAELKPPECSPRPRRKLRTGKTLTFEVSCASAFEPVYPKVQAGPANGTVTAVNPYGYFRYEPKAGFAGVDTITFRAENAKGHTDFVQEIEVGPEVNTVPSCSPDWNVTTRQAPVTLQLSCYDEDGDGITLSIVGGPEHGDLGPLTDRSVEYTPDPGFVGEDEFTFRGNDGRGNSATVTQKIRVLSVEENSPPQCQGFGTQTEPGQSVSFSLYGHHCYDSDGDDLTIEIVDAPDHGDLVPPESPSPYGQYKYTPADGFRGTDTFTFRASDGRSTSPTRTVSIQVGSTVSTPRCTSFAANVERGGERRLQLVCRVDFGGDVKPKVLTAPAHGTLSEPDDQGWVTYRPDAGFVGTDSFTFGATWNGADGEPAKVDLRVAEPRAQDQAPPDQPPADPPKQPEVPKGPPPPAGDPFEQAVEQKLGGEAVMLEGLPLAGNRVYVPLSARGGTFTVDSAIEKLAAVVCQSDCTVTAGKQITLTGGAAARAAKARKPLRLRSQKLTLGGAQPGVVSLRLTKAQRKSVRRARRATLRVAIAVRDASGVTRRATVRFRLKAR